MNSNKPNRRETELEMWHRRVDEIIDYSEKPEARRIGPVIQINCFAADLPFAMEVDGQLHYRGYLLLPVAKPKQRKQRDIQMDIEGKR